MEIHVIPDECRADAGREAGRMMRSMKILDRAGRYSWEGYHFLRSNNGMIRLAISFKDEHQGALALIYNNQREIVSVSFNPISENAARKLPAAMRTFLDRIRDYARQGKATRRPFSQPPPYWHNPPRGGKTRNSA